MSRRKTEPLALLFDVLNWLTPFLTHLTTHKDLKERVERNLDRILDLINLYGKVEIGKAFTDYSDSNIPDWLPFLFISKGVQLAHTPDLNRSKRDDKKPKRTDDMMLAREIFLMPHENPKISTLFCVTGDGHLFPAISAFRASGRKAMIVSTNGTSAMLRDYCDGFWQIPIEDERADNSEALLTRIDELLLSGKEFSKDGLLDALREDERWRSKPDRFRNLTIALTLN